MSRGNIILRCETLCYKVIFYYFDVKDIYYFDVKDIRKMGSTSDATSLSLQIHQQTQNMKTEILLWKKCENSYLRGVKVLSNTAPNMYRYNI